MQPATQSDPEALTLGKLLIKRRATVKEILIPVAIAAAAFLFGVFALIVGCFDAVQAGPDKKDAFESIGIGIVVIPLACLLAGYCWLSLQTELHCYELGIVKKNPLGTVMLRFDELEAMTFSKKVLRHDGATGAYSYRMQFYPLPSCGKKSIALSTSDTIDQQELEAIRDYIADFIAERMLAELEKSGSQPWTPLMRIKREGLECQTRSGWQFVPWSNLRLEIEGEGFLKVYDIAHHGMLVGVGDICENFYPGLLVVNDKLAQLSRAAG